MFTYFFPIQTPPDNIQPSYKSIRMRHELMRQIRRSRLRLRKTFIVDQYSQTTYRGVVLFE